MFELKSQTLSKTPILNLRTPAGFRFEGGAASVI
jgi:hypothetical protein